MLELTGEPDEEKINELISLPFEEKEKIAMNIAKDSVVTAKNPVVCFSGGKKSLVLLHLIKQSYDGALNVLHIDTMVEFDNIYLYIEKMRKLWRYNLIREKQSDIEAIRIAENKEECCKKLKMEPLKNAIKRYEIDYLYVGMTWEENEKFVPDEDDHYFVYPILHFTERDIWDHIRKYNLPYCSLYDQGYRKLDCEPCTKIVSEGTERSDSDIQEAEMIKDRLMRLGYL